MASSVPSVSVRQSSRRTPTRGCSCDALIALAQQPAGAEFLAEFGLDEATLVQARRSLHDSGEPELTNWHVRLRQRRGGTGPTDDVHAVLLAIVRSADCHAYRLLEQCGASCARIRKVILERGGARGGATGPSERPSRRMVRPPADRRHGDERRPNAASDRRRSGSACPVTTLTKTPEDGGSARELRPTADRVDARPLTFGRFRRGGRSGGSGSGASGDPPDERLRCGESEAITGRRDANHSPVRPGETATDGVPRRTGAVGRDGRALLRHLRDRSIGRSVPLADKPPTGVESDDPRIVGVRPVRASPASLRPVPATDSSSRALLPGVESPAVATGGRARHADADRTRAEPSSPSPLAAFPPGQICRAVVGRDDVLTRLADGFLRASPRPVLLVGEAGSGRTTVGAALAATLGQPVERLDATSCDDDQLEAVLADAQARGVVVVVDDLDRVAGDSCPTWIGPIAHAWATSSPRTLTLVSSQGRARLASWLPDVSGVFDVVELAPLSEEVAIKATEASGEIMLRTWGLRLGTEATFAKLVRDATRWLSGRAMPARALDLLDLACARARRVGAATLRANDWREVIAERTGLTLSRIAGDQERDALRIETRLGERVVGHEAAIEILADLFRRGRAGFRGPRPLVSTLLAGPSGVGKTELAKALAAVLFASPQALVRLDMSEYAESHAVARIVGAPPGYVGYERGGVLTDALVERPHCVVLLDEIEKAHRDVHQLLLQVLDEGWLTDGRGRRVSFANCVIVMTSNLGAARLSETPATDDAAVLHDVAAAFPPELWNRIEAPLVLRRLTPDQLGEICRRLAQQSSDRLHHERGIRYRLAPAACQRLVELTIREGGQGARPLRHLLARHVEAVIARAVLTQEIEPGDRVVVACTRTGAFEVQRSGPAAVPA
ncbi:MAG: AAA family ATPase [Myxococcales bacterium FL481]|nr:MAG: AAA family ATPase [Myxococcales bacterium FL481]